MPEYERSDQYHPRTERLQTTKSHKTDTKQGGEQKYTSWEEVIKGNSEETKITQALPKWSKQGAEGRSNRREQIKRFKATEGGANRWSNCLVSQESVTFWFWCYNQWEQRKCAGLEELEIQKDGESNIRWTWCTWELDCLSPVSKDEDGPARLGEGVASISQTKAERQQRQISEESTTQISLTSQQKEPMQIDNLKVELA